MGRWSHERQGDQGHIGWRDRDLGDALRDLEVPDHAPGFFPALSERMDEQDRTAKRAEAEAGVGGRTGAERRRRRSPDSRRGWRLAWLAAPLAVVVLAVAWIVAGQLGVEVLRPEVASAAEIKQKMASALADVHAIKAVLVVGFYDESSGGLDEMSWEVAMTARGDFRMSGISRCEDISYDAGTGTQRGVAGGENGEPLVASELKGLAPGPPDPGPADWVLDRDLGAVVRAMLAADDPAVSETTFDGRAAWLLVAEVEPNKLSNVSGDHIEVTVDQETGFPTKVAESREGRLLQEVRLEDFQIDPVLSEDEFALAFPDGSEVTQTDAGFRRTSLEGVVAAAGYRLLVPGWTPAGYQLAEVAIAEKGGPTGKEGMNPPSDSVVSLAYRRGFDRMIITTRTVGDDPSLWSDPLASGEGFIDAPETVRLIGGALDGVSAELLIDPRTAPHVWAISGSLVVTVAGDLSRAELLKVAQSLAPR